MTYWYHAKAIGTGQCTFASQQAIGGSLPWSDRAGFSLNAGA